jgi:hypothetical protein
VLWKTRQIFEDTYVWRKGILEVKSPLKSIILVENNKRSRRGPLRKIARNGRRIDVDTAKIIRNKKYRTKIKFRRNC